MSGIERKNCWQPAEQAGHTRPGPMQRLLRYARWDADAVRDDLRAYAPEHLGADRSVLVVDEILFRRWQRAGTWQRIFEQLQAQADARELITWDLNIDSTVCRAINEWL
ncbi:hypothetical protein [Streptomyces sp. NPDC048411]|uniref:hypothetical protein n=1 Tax=Streptomyces sp. NPDC048411 TaxID=3157206 RepID=UPI0034545F99